MTSRIVSLTGKSERSARTVNISRSDVLKAYPRTGASAMESATQWLVGQLPFVEEEPLSRFMRDASAELLHESFWRPVPFGTGGVRGPVGFGRNRINPTVVCLTIQAHSEFLTQHLESHPNIDRSVVIANDVRVFNDQNRALAFMGRDNPLLGLTSRDFALLAARVYAANGFVAYLLDPDDDDSLLTTPELSFLIRHLGAAGGINMSASHNPPDDNGIKVYDEFGGQYLPPFDQQLTDLTSSVDHVQIVDLDEARANKLIVPLAPSDVNAYLDLYMEKARTHDLFSRRHMRILFTPLCGCGERNVGSALTRLGFDVHLPSDQRADGTFAHIPLLAPNPEVAEAMEPARAEADRVGAKIVIATDPDADRVGVEVKRTTGDWVHLTGNQIATILAYRLLLDLDGPQLRGGVYQTIVTTPAVRAIAELAGCAHVVDDLLVGFKYIGAAVGAFADDLGESADDTQLLAFAAEESHGYLVTPRLRDKDALSAAVYVARLQEDLSADGHDVLDYLDRIYAQVGAFGDRGRSLTITGSAGVEAIERVMGELRGSHVAAWGGRTVAAFTDFRDEDRFGAFLSSTDREARNILVYEVEDARITLRPSGTEPKLKLYISTAEAPGSVTAQAAADELAAAVYRELVPRFGTKISGPAAALPDVMTLEAKIAFDRVVVAEAERRLGAADDLDEAARWLTTVLDPIVPGSAKIQIAEPALLAVARTWTPQAFARAQAVLDRAGR